MTFEETTARYIAGDTDLKSETTYIYQTQGRDAALDFARAFDEAVGAAPYNAILGHISALDSAQTSPRYNEKAAAESEMYKQSLVRERIQKQEAEAMQQAAVATQRVKELADITAKNKAKLLENLAPPKPEAGAGIAGLKPAPKVNKALLILAAVVVIAFLMKGGK